MYHGSINDATRIRADGLDAARLPTWITRDFAAARNAIDPTVLAPNERTYSGFNSALPGSSEIVVRTPEQAALFNGHIVR